MPSLYVIAGPNGAGKTTFIKRFAPRELALLDFINADEIARGLSPFVPERAQIEAGRLVLTRFRQFVEDGRDFVLETTLSGKTYRRLFERAKQSGYAIQLDFLMLPTVKHSKLRVARRVLSGGHNVPEADLLRRFAVSLRNLFTIYRPCLTTGDFIPQASGSRDWSPTVRPRNSSSKTKRPLRKPSLTLS